MEQTKHDRETGRRVPFGRIAASTLAIGAMSSSAFAVSSAGATTSRVAKSVVISTAKTAKLGTFLVSGKTIYTLKPSATPCAAQCVKIWPEVLLPKGVTKATAGPGVSAAKLGTVKRAGGALQVTYSGKPLYFFSADTAAGQVHGNLTDTWGKWSVDVTVKPTTSSAGSGAGSGGTNSGTGGVAF